MAKRGILIILSGPSGVGKGTVRHEVFQHPELNLKYSISMTTRKPREGEQDGVDYFFVSRERFKQAIKNKELLEYTEFVGNYYGTPRKYVEDLLNEGYNVMLEIEVEGAQRVMTLMPECISIFLVPPTLEELEYRIRNRRTESENIVKQRLEKAHKEMELQENYSYVVINKDVPAAEAEIVAIIRAAQNK